MIFSLNSLVQAEIDPKVREICLPAADFLGCVKAYSTKFIKIDERDPKQLTTELIGNKCPKNNLYSGAGNCQLIVCRKNIFNQDIVVKNEDMECKGKFENLDFKNQFIKAIVDPRCPNKEPIIYSRSSCTTRKYNTDS